MSFTAAQCRAARAILGWSQADLAEHSKVAIKTIADFEREERRPYERTLGDIRTAFELARVEFSNGDNPGLRVVGDRAFGHVYDEGRHVGWIRNGEFRVGRDERLVAIVRDGELFDPKTGERFGALAEVGIRGDRLPAALRAKIG